ncbi:MAG: outer membrane protein [Salinivenus sp.]
MDASSNRLLLLRSALLVCLIGLGMSVGAVAQPTVSLRGNVGASFFQSPTVEENLLNSGTDLGLGVDVRVYRGLSVSLQGGYNQFTLNQENARIQIRGPLQAGDISLVNVSVGTRYTYENDSDASPYALVGIGLYRGQQTDAEVFGEQGEGGTTESKMSTERGYYVGLGSNFQLNDTYSVFVEPRFTFLQKQSGSFLISPSGTETPRFFTLRLGLDVRLW